MGRMKCPLWVVSGQTIAGQNPTLSAVAQKRTFVRLQKEQDSKTGYVFQNERGQPFHWLRLGWQGHGYPQAAALSRTRQHHQYGRLYGHEPRAIQGLVALIANPAGPANETGVP